MTLEEQPRYVTSGNVTPYNPVIAGENLLPGGANYSTWTTTAPRSVLVEQAPHLLQRARMGLWDLCVEYKGALGGSLGNVMFGGMLSALHYGPHSFGIGLALGGLALVTGAAGTLAALAHVGNPPPPHEIATHQAGHIIGRIVGTAFGFTLLLGEAAIALAAGPFSPGTWVATILTSLGIGAALGQHHGGRRITHHALQTDRVRADTDRIFAVAELTTATTLPTGTAGAQSSGPFDSHPLTLEILRALSVVGVVGASVVALSVATSERWDAVTNLPDGVAPQKVIDQLAVLQGTLKIRSGGLKLAKGVGGHQVVWSVNNVPLAQLPPPGEHPMIEAAGDVSIWDPIRLGLDDDGNEVAVTLAGTPGILIAGGPGSGKSNASAAVLVTATRAADCQLWTIDGSGRELVIFDAVAIERCGPNMDQALAILATLQEEISRRGELLKKARATELNAKLAQELDLDCILLAIGEVAFFTGDDSEPKKAKMFGSSLRDIVSRGRACGILGAYDTQKPEDRTVPSIIRDMVPVKMALRCETVEQVGTILGRGMHKTCPAHEIGELDYGVAYIKGIPGRKPFRMRTHKITPEERYAIVDQYAIQDAAPPPGRPTPPDGGGVEDHFESVARAIGEHARTTPVAHLKLVRQDRYRDHYPDGSAVPANALERWNLLFDFPEGFVWRDLVPIQVENGKARTSWQNVMDVWETRGWVKRIGHRGNATLYIRADLLEEVRDGRTA